MHDDWSRDSAGPSGERIRLPKDNDTTLFDEPRRELGMSPKTPVALTRASVHTGVGPRLSVLKWGETDPQIVCLHGRGQNAHTWDRVLAAIGAPALAVDLPGHGHSEWRVDHDYRPMTNVPAVATVVERLAARATVVVGMSLGGLTGIMLAAWRPDLVRRLVVVDVTPGTVDVVTHLSPSERGATALLDGPTSFASLSEMVDLAHRASPHRTRAAVARGVLRNSHLSTDGRWTWRYDQAALKPVSDVAAMWAAMSSLTVPVMVVKGANSPFVTEEHLARVRRQMRSVRVEVVPGAGHAVQSDRPIELASLIADFADIRDVSEPDPG
jgi:esterase